MEEKVILSKRLSEVANMVTKGNRTADIGCDHGFVAIYLIQNEIAPFVFALDVNEGPLERAREHIAKYKLDSYIKTDLSNGLEILSAKDNVDTAIMAGMGGRLMQDIIAAALKREFWVKELVLQPQSQWGELRKFLRMNHYEIKDEKMIEEEGKFYPVIRAIAVDSPENEKQMRFGNENTKQYVYDCFGALLIHNKDDVLRKYLEKEKNKFDHILDTMADPSQKGYTQVKEKTELLDLALNMIKE